MQGKKTSTPVIYTAHGFHFYKGAPLLNWLLYYPVEKWMARYTDCLITINQEDYNTAVKKKFKARRIERINGAGLDIERFQPQTAENKKNLRVKYGYAEDDFILISIGELNYTKHQDLSIKMLKTLKTKCPNAKLLLAGKGDLLQKYQEYARELGG